MCIRDSVSHILIHPRHLRGISLLYSGRSYSCPVYKATVFYMKTARNRIGPGRSVQESKFLIPTAIEHMSDHLWDYLSITMCPKAMVFSHFLMDLRGIEPLSESPSSQVSSITVSLRTFPHMNAERQASMLSSFIRSSTSAKLRRRSSPHRRCRLLKLRET